MDQLSTEVSHTAAVAVRVGQKSDACGFRSKRSTIHLSLITVYDVFMCVIFFRLEAIACRLEATASRLEAIASRLEAIAIRLEAIVINRPLP